MALTPIDLQTLFTQMDKAGREQSALKEGAALHRAIYTEVQNRKTEERMEGVVETEQTGEGLSGVHEKKERESGAGGKQNGAHGAPHAAEEDKAAPRASYHDPALGTLLDLKG